jgi:hypothetical protein
VTSAKPDKQPAKPKKKRLKRFALACLGLLALSAIFHRPILLALVRFAAPRIAAWNHLHLEFQINGSLLSDVSLANVRLTPTGRTPVAKITVASAHADYSLGGLLRHGLGGFLKNITASDVSIEMADLPPEPGRAKTPRQLDFAAGTQQILEIPALAPENIDVRNLAVVVHMHDGDDLELLGVNLFLDPQKPGRLQVARLKTPGHLSWKNLDATLALKNKRLVVEGLTVAENVTVERLDWDASRYKDGRVDCALRAGVFGGALTAELVNKKNGSRFNTDLHVAAANLALAQFGHFLGTPVPLNGSVEQIEAHIVGDLNAPASWSGGANASVTTASFGPMKLDRGTAKLTLENGAFKLETTELRSAANQASMQVGGQLPVRVEKFPDTALDGTFQINAPDLSQADSIFLRGDASAEGRFRLHEREFHGEIVLTGKNIDAEKFDVAQADLKAEATVALAQKNPASAFYDNVTSRLTAQFLGVRAGRAAFDSAHIAAEFSDGWLHLKPLGIKRGDNTAELRGDFHPPRDLSKIADADFDAGFTIVAQDAAAFNAETDLTGFNGALEASGHIAHRDGFFEGQIDASGKNLTLEDFNAESLNLAVEIKKSVAEIRDLKLVVDAKSWVAGSGKIGLHKPFDYAGRLSLDIPDLAIFTPLLERAGVSNPVAGALTLDWDGGGSVAEIRHSGSVQLKLMGGKFGPLQPIDAEIAGKYSPELAEIPTFHIRADKTDLKAQIDLHDTKLRISEILLQQRNIGLLRGGITLPLDLRTPTNPDSLLPHDGKIFANLSSDEINLETLLILPGQTSPLKGFVKFSLNADGPIDNFVANALLRGRGLQPKAAPALAPGNLEVNCDLRDNQLVLGGTLQQAAISPLQIRGRFPFSLPQFLREKKIDESSPVEFSVKLPSSPAIIIGQLAPGIRYIEGTMGIDMKAAGTIAKPQLSGSAFFDFSAIRLRDQNAPAINGFRAAMEFVNNDLTVRNFGGEISGGPFNISGKMHFEKMTEPLLDLRLTSQGALLVRNETLTVRADSDIKIAGPFTAANVSGTVALTKSKFFRDVDLLPIDLPGRAAPKPMSETQPGFSLKPPFAAWTFDVEIKSKDPFLIRGNLAKGAASPDLKLVGTGAAPALAGSVHLDSFTASLPFSRLDVDHGYVYFSADDPFVPVLDIQGSSSLHDYDIRVYISGTPEKPVTLFTSEPPLPQEQILALLGTGATTEELTGKSDVLAGRAAMLVFQKFYRKIFKTKPSETESFLSRFELDAGAVDPRTGRQEASARFKVSEKFYIIGDVDAQGGLRGQVKYLRRYR